MATKSKRHTHKYHQVVLPVMGKVWACALPECTHHMPPHYAPLVEGKNSLCWKCNGPMVLHAENMEQEKPICDDCSAISLIAARYTQPEA